MHPEDHGPQQDAPSDEPKSANQPLPLQVENIPESLKAIPHWVVWKPKIKPGKKIGKVPIDPKTGRAASTTDPATWGSFVQALTLAKRKKFGGIGFVFTAEVGIVGIDLDKCRDPQTGVLAPWAREIVDAAASYTEVSVYGGGVHILVFGTLPPEGKKRGDIEMYQTARFFTVSGHRVPGTPPEILEHQAAIDSIHAKAFAPAEPAQEAQPQPSWTEPSAVADDAGNDDDWVIGSARRAKNGRKFSALWDGDASAYSSPSEATAALCCMLAFWTKHDPVQMDRLFRKSGLMRDKWDEPRGDTTWGQEQIKQALTQVKQSVRKGRRRKNSSTPNAPSAAPNASKSEGAKPDVLIPRAHQTLDGYLEVSTFDFATNVLDVLPAHALYQRGEVPGEVVGECGSRRFLPSTPERARLLVDKNTRLCSWSLVMTEFGEEVAQCTFATCNSDHAKLVLARACDHTRVPELISIIRCPSVAGREFEPLHPGFNAKHGIFYDEHPALRGIHCICDPNRIDEILNDLLTDFPFQSRADWQNYVGLLVAQIVRPAIVGNWPLHLVLSCMERSGKTKLVELVLGRIIQGASVPALALSEDESEREKRILALLMSGTTIVHLDNLPPFLDSRVLASLITAEVFQGRVLGLSKVACVRNDLVMVGSGNNVRASPEVSKRCIPIRLLPSTERPDERTEFAHPDLPAYLDAARPIVVGALVGMVVNWIDAGKPLGKVPFGGFESFASIVGGILGVQGYGSWLGNRREWLGDADVLGGDLAALVEHWRATYPNAVTPGQLFDLARSLGLFPEVTGGDEHRARTLFGRRILLPATQRLIDGVRITASGEGSSRRYTLVPLERRP